jgi:hypothetical protein
MLSEKNIRPARVIVKEMVEQAEDILTNLKSRYVAT